MSGLHGFFFFPILSDPLKLQIYSYSCGKFCLIFLLSTTIPKPACVTAHFSRLLLVNTWAQAKRLEALADLQRVFKWSQTKCFKRAVLWQLGPCSLRCKDSCKRIWMLGSVFRALQPSETELVAEYWW